MKNKFILLSLVTSVLLFQGCSETETKAKEIETKKVENKSLAKKSKEVEKKEIYSSNNSIIEKVFKDSAKIGTDGKYMLIVFGTNTDPYTDMLKDDINKSNELQKELKGNFSAYYLKAHENLRHKLLHENEYMEVDTKTMISIYGVDSTPTLIFTDKKGKAIILVPGYMPSKQFLVTLEFIKSENWKGKDRKNGEVYETLRDFYLQNGINVKKKDKE